MKRSGPIRRKKPLRRAAPRRVARPGPGSDPAYLMKVRGLYCLIGGRSGCPIPSHAHHAGPKSNDSTAVPLCWLHHEAWHSANGVFKGWTKAARREWAEKAIAETRALILSKPGLDG